MGTLGNYSVDQDLKDMIILVDWKPTMVFPHFKMLQSLSKLPWIDIDIS